MDDLTDDLEEEEPMPPLIDDVDNVVVDFPNLQNLQPLQVEKVPLEDPIPFDELEMNQPLPQLEDQHIQLGFVETFFLPVPIQKYQVAEHIRAPFTSGPSPDAIRLWAKFFNSVDQSPPTVSIPTEWLNFFTKMMLQQSSFDWSKLFLQSSAWPIISKGPNGNSFCFSLPHSRPSVTIIELFWSEDVELAGPENQMDLAFVTNLDGPMQQFQTLPPSVTVQSAPRAKRGKTVPISDVDLRRSPQLHANTRGFKSPICKDRKCLGCNSDPLLLSSSVVRELGTSFCKVDPSLLIDDKLKGKPMKKAPIAKPARKPTKGKQPKSPKDGPDADSQNGGSKAKKSKK